MEARHVVVTGATRGIGRGIAIKLAAAGYTVHGTYAQDAASAHSLKDSLGGSLVLYQADFRERGQTRGLIAALKDLALDGIVNNAGIIEFEKADGFDEGLWDRTVEVNLTAPLMLAHGLGGQLRPGAAVVNIASINGYTGSFNSIAYATSKAALISLTKSLGNILGQRGCRAVGVAPGWIDTGMSTAASMEATGYTPLGRNGTPADIAGVVEFLLSPGAAFVNGTTVVADGGYNNVDVVMLKESLGAI